jgi:hypothetical protein
VKLEEDRALRKAHDIGSAAARDQELETQKEEETRVTCTDVQTSEKEAPLVQETPSTSRRRKTRWDEHNLREAQEYGAPRTYVRESRAPQIFSSYMVVVSELLEAESSNFQEASQQ